MFVFMSKLLPILIYPLGLCWFLLAAVVFLNLKPKLKQAILYFVIAVLFLGSNGWVATSLTRSIEQQYLPPSMPPQAEVIVVLGGATEAAVAPRTSVEVNGAGDRVIAGVRLYREKAAPIVLLSGGIISWMSSRPSTPATEMRDLMVFMGVPENALVLQDQSQNTHEDAVYSAKILNEKNIHTIILVTSAIHMPRSVALFEAQGFKVIPYPVDYSVTDYDWHDLWHGDWQSQLLNVIPTASNLSQTTGCLKEILGRFVYRLQGWL